MGKYFAFKNGVESLRALPIHLLTDGEEVSPRGQLTHELRDVMIEITDPTDPTMLGVGRKWSQAIAVAEFLQLVGGFSDPVRMQQIAPTFRSFLNGGAFHGAYGPRVSMQMDPVRRRLLQDPDTRQAIVTIWDPLHDLMQEGRKDLPCTISFNFAIRRGQLCMTTHMRSNDVWWGWSYDLFQFTQLQCTMARSLNLPVGPYVHFANSFHLYDRDREAALSMRDYEGSGRPVLDGIGERYSRWSTIQRDAEDIFYARWASTPERLDLTEGEWWMYNVMANA